MYAHGESDVSTPLGSLLSDSCCWLDGFSDFGKPAWTYVKLENYFCLVFVEIGSSTEAFLSQTVYTLIVSSKGTSPSPEQSCLDTRIQFCLEER